MNARLIFLETLLPVLVQMSRSPNQSLAAEASEEVAAKSRELARIKRKQAETSKEGAGREAALAA